MSDDGQSAKTGPANRDDGDGLDPSPGRRRVPGRKGAFVAAVVLVSAVVAIVLTSRGADDEDASPAVLVPVDPSTTVAPPDGVVTLEVASRRHVEGDVVYPSAPGAGGDHAPAWLNCGFYDSIQIEEKAVHSLEHGAVWVAYRSDLPSGDVARLRDLATQPFTLVTPVDGLGSDVVASAWGAQLTPDGVGDPRLGQFLEFFRQGPQTPELGAPCSSGVGTPL